MNTGPGDQFDPHVGGDWVSYTDFSVTPSQIRYHNLVTGQDAAIPNAGAQDVVSHVDGTRVVYMHITSGRQAIYLDDVSNGSGPVELAPGAGVIRADPAIGGQTVAWEDSTADPDSSQIVAYDLNTATMTQLTSGALQNVNPDVSPDGSVIVWTQCSSPGVCHIWQAQQSGGSWTVQQLTSGSGTEQLPHTNGQIVTYDSMRTVDGVTTQEVYWQPVGGGTEHQITSAPSQARNAHVSGSFISFEMRDVTASDPSWRVYVYSLATGTTYAVPNTPNQDQVLNGISVNPDGTGRVVWNVNEPSGGYNVYSFLFTVCDLALSLSVAPSTATAGMTVTASGTVANNASVSRQVTLSASFQYTSTDGHAVTLSSSSQTVTLTPGQSIQRPIIFLVRSSIPKGTYTVTVSASDVTGSTATSTTFNVT